MPKHKNHDHDGDDDDKGGRDGGDGREREHDEGNAAHIEIEERRFRGGLPPTPERYAHAREQWNRLPGAVPRTPPGPVGPPSDDADGKPAAAPGAGDDHDNQKEGS